MAFWLIDLIPTDKPDFLFYGSISDDYYATIPIVMIPALEILLSSSSESTRFNYYVGEGWLKMVFLTREACTEIAQEQNTDATARKQAAAWYMVN